MSAAVPLCALLELQRGKTALSPLVGATAFAVVNRASNDLLEQFAFGMDPVEKCEWRKNAFYLAEFLLENTSAYRLNLNLDEDFVQLLENL